jgi:hypothetical protein
MATSYRRPTAIASIGKGGAAPYNTPISGDIQPVSASSGRKLLDQLRDKMRSVHYALATEKAYRHWIVEFLRTKRPDYGAGRPPTAPGFVFCELFALPVRVLRTTMFLDARYFGVAGGCG